jgi:hypothetical protein
LRGIRAGSKSAGFHTFCGYTHFGTGFACSREASLTLHQCSVHRSVFSLSHSDPLELADTLRAKSKRGVDAEQWLFYALNYFNRLLR